MNFEESLVYELSSISAINNKIYPLNAKEGTNPPFLVYVSSQGERTQTLTGYVDSLEISCDIHIIAESYQDLKSLADAVLTKLQSFFGRSIGLNGPYIKSFIYSEPIEGYSDELNYHRSAFDIRVRI